MRAALSILFNLTRKIIMTEETNKVEEVNDPHNVYSVTVTFLSPEQGNARVIARDPEHAKELALEMLKHVKEVEIVNIVDVRDIVVPEDIAKQMQEIESALAEYEEVSAELEESDKKEPTIN